MKNFITFLVTLAVFNSFALEYAPKGPPSLEETVIRSDKIAVFTVHGVEYVKKKMTFTDTRRDAAGAEHAHTYTTTMLLTKYSIEVLDPIKNTIRNEIYEVYSDGGLSDGGMVLKSSVGYEMEKGDEVVIMLEFDNVNNIYLSTLHNSTVFRIILDEEEAKLEAYSGMQYYKYKDDITRLLSVPNGFKPDYINDVFISDIMEFSHE